MSQVRPTKKSLLLARLDVKIRDLYIHYYAPDHEVYASKVNLCVLMGTIARWHLNWSGVVFNLNDYSTQDRDRGDDSVEYDTFVFLIVHIVNLTVVIHSLLCHAMNLSSDGINNSEKGNDHWW